MSVEVVDIADSSQLAALEDDLRSAAAQGLVQLSESRPRQERGRARLDAAAEELAADEEGMRAGSPAPLP
jgi:hypothetical protein